MGSLGEILPWDLFLTNAQLTGVFDLLLRRTSDRSSAKEEASDRGRQSSTA